MHQIDAAIRWDDMAFLEVSLLKGFAFDFAVQESESYSIVIDRASPNSARVPRWRWFGPHHLRNRGHRHRRGPAAAGSARQASVQTLSLTSISAPYAITIQNPDAPGGSLQTECSDEDWYDPENQPRVSSHEDRCSFGVGVGFVHFDVASNDGSARCARTGLH